MANRSYLFSIDFDRTIKEREKGEKIIGLSEYNYSIPLSYKILVSQNSKLSHSINWDYEHPIAIQGDYQKGKEKLFNFLDKLDSMELTNFIFLKEHIVKTKEFLNNPINNLKNIILECGEIYEMGDDEIEIQNKELYTNEILGIDREIEEYKKHCKEWDRKIHVLREGKKDLESPKGLFKKLFSSNSNKKIEKINKTIQTIEMDILSELGIDYWTNILYFSFENE